MPKVDATSIASVFHEEIKVGVEQSVREGRGRPRLVGFIANDDAGAQLYARWTAKACERDGITYELRQVCVPTRFPRMSHFPFRLYVHLQIRPFVLLALQPISPICHTSHSSYIYQICVFVVLTLSILPTCHTRILPLHLTGVICGRWSG